MVRVRGHFRNWRWVRSYHRAPPRRGFGVGESIAIGLLVVLVLMVLYEVAR